MRTFIAIILLASLIAIFVYTQNNNSGHFSEDEDIEVASVSDLILGDDDADAEISKYVNIEETEVDRNSDNEIDNDIAGFLNDIDMGGPEMADGPTGTPYSAISPEYFGDAGHKEKYIHPEKHVAVSGVNNIVGVLKEAPFQPQETFASKLTPSNMPELRSPLDDTVADKAIVSVFDDNL